MKFVSSSARRGFTLIELLVVIAIIGILSAVVLASLNTARNKGADAAIKSNIDNARAAAELYYDNNSNSYLGVCGAATGILNMVNGAKSAYGSGSSVVCSDVAGAWAMSSTLKATTSLYCVDSTGKTGTAAVVGQACP